MIVSAEKAIELINHNQVVALPSETVYGLAGRFDRPEALKLIFATKKRPFFDPLIIHISHKDQLAALTQNIPSTAHILMDAFWPGPLTLVLERSIHVDPMITSGLNTVAIRMPAHPLFLKVIEHTAPLAAPSANMFGHTSPTSAPHVENEFTTQVPVVDGGPSDIGIESTVVQIEENEAEAVLIILRPGMIGKKELEASLQNKLTKKFSVQTKTSIVSPGHMTNHYQPLCPLVVASHEHPWSRAIHKAVCEKMGWDESLIAHKSMSFHNQNPSVTARTFYAQLRANDKLDKQYIYLQVGKDFRSEDWTAIRDRVEKASTFSIHQENSRIFVHDKLLALHF